MGEIAEALLHMGGSAHRDHVIAHLKANRRSWGGSELSLRARAMAVFAAHSRLGSAGARSLFREPFGPGMNRWALTPEAERFLRAGGAGWGIAGEARI